MGKKKQIVNWEQDLVNSKITDLNEGNELPDPAPIELLKVLPNRSPIKIPLRNYRVTFQFQGKYGGFLDVDAIGAKIYRTKMEKQPKHGLIKSVELIEK